MSILFGMSELKLALRRMKESTPGQDDTSYAQAVKY